MQAVHKDLRDLARAAERVAADANLAIVVARLRDYRAERDRVGTRVAVVGDFNRGKSTLVNRLIGTDVLPTGNVPLTRAFVVVRAVAADPAVLDIRWPSGATERRSLTTEDPWHGLVLDHEPSAVNVAEGQSGPEEPQLLLSVPSDWLSRVEVELIDTPGLHEGRVDHLLQTQRAVALSDVAVMAISALSPLSHLEQQFLEEELLTKRVPHVIVALTKVDQLPPDEVEEFTDWFRARIGAVSLGITVVVGPGAVGGTEALAVLRDSIEDLAHSSDVIQRRDRRLAWQIADACAAIRSAALAARDQLEVDEASRHAAVMEAKQQLSEDDLRWNQLRLGLDARRLRFIETIRESVTAETSELFETLSVELHRVTDVKAWWERELPVRLRRELKNLTHSLESQISATISRDLSWLDSEVARTFTMNRKLAVARPMSAVAIGELPELELEDIRRRRTATRIITAVGGIAGAAIAFASGIGMPAAFTIGGSAIAGIIAERDADAKIEEQRALVRGHVRRLLDDVIDQFKEKLSTEVERSYRIAFEELQEAQATWRTAHLEALASTTGTGPDITTWTDIECRVDDIAGQIPADHDDKPDVGSMLALGIEALDQDDQEGDRT
jgi:GTPase SAR1 family protein